MKQTKKKKPRVFRTLIWCIHNNAKMTKNIDDEKPDGKKNKKQKQQSTLFFGR
jgi:hypothetical protein